MHPGICSRENPQMTLRSTPNQPLKTLTTLRLGLHTLGVTGSSLLTPKPFYLFDDNDRRHLVAQRSRPYSLNRD